VITPEILKELASRQGVSETEFEVLHQAMAGKAMSTIAAELKIDAAAARKRLGEVYRKFGIAGKGPGKLAKLQQVLMAQAQQPAIDAGHLPSGRPDDGLIEVDAFYGRAQELTQLERLIVAERCRLIEIIGLGGIGKTTLSVQLAKQVYSDFDQVIWRPLGHAPPLKELLKELLYNLEDRSDRLSSLQATEPELLADLLNQMQHRRHLLVLDGAESILQSGELAGRYREGYEGYSELLTLVAQSDHQSCLVLTSVEKTQEFTALEGQRVQAFHLQGLQGSEASSFLQARGAFAETASDWPKLVQLYSGNPLTLKIAVVTILELFGGSISDFLEQGTAVFGDIRNLLEAQVNRLSPLERDILYWLAVYCEPVALSDLRADLVPSVSQPRLMEALESLGRRSLVERDRALFSLQPVVMEYLAERLIEKMTEEIRTGHLRRFNSHALIKAQAKDYIREQQIHSMLQPLLERLLALYEQEERLQQILMERMALWQQSPLKPGYAAGNVLNLLWQIGLPVSDCDFSRLTIRQAYLKDLRLHRVNFSGADLSESVFAEKLGSILAIAFQPDGKLLAMGDTEGHIRLWNVETGEQTATWQGHEDWVRSVAFSPDGRYLASGSEDRTIRLWDIKTGQCLKVLRSHTSWLRSVAFSPDSQQLASGGEDKIVRLWDVETGGLLYELATHSRLVRSVAFSPDGKTLASGSDDRTIQLWDLASGVAVQTFQQHSQGVRSVAFSPDGKTLASGSSDRMIRLWDLTSGECVRQLEGHRGWVWSVTFSPDGKRLASGSEDQTVRIWDLADDQLHDQSQVLPGHTSWVRSVAFSPNGKLLASGSDDQTVKLWDVDSAQRICTLQGYARGIRSVAFSPDGQTLASGSEDQRVRIWDLATEQCLRSLEQHTERVWSVAFSPDGQTLASGSEDQTIRLWQVNTGSCLKTLAGHTDGVHSVAFTPDGLKLASGSSDNSIRLWNVTTGQPLAELSGHQDWVWSVAFSPDGRILASGSSDLTVKLWDVERLDCLSTLTGHHHWIRSVAFSPDGQILASSSVGRTVRLWRVKTGEPLSQLDGFKNGIRSVAFSPDSRILASGSDDRVVRLWDIESGRCLQELKGHVDRIKSVAFSVDGATLASGSNDETIKIWDVTTGRELKSLRIPQLYEGMNITDVNLTPAQKTTLMALGAVDHSLSCR
jgi:WD40 repeat protein/DNA-binding CsgD family transcriptional regulator